MSGVGLLLVVALTIFSSARGNPEGDALFALRRSLTDPGNVLQSWNPTLPNPCTWSHITCNADNRVTRVLLANLNLSGRLAPELGKLERLEYLKLFKNNIFGPIPAEIGNLNNLLTLDLFDNKLSGIIPPSLGNLKSLSYMRLNNNQLTGPIPMALSAISTLKYVDLSTNNLCGPIPTGGSFELTPYINLGNNPRLGKAC